MSLRDRRQLGAIHLSYGTACVLLASDADAREEEHSPAVRTRDLKHSSTFRNYKQPELRFRALLVEGTSEMQLAMS
jgi:hypothetical protein